MKKINESTRRFLENLLRVVVFMVLEGFLLVILVSINSREHLSSDELIKTTFERPTLVIEKLSIEVSDPEPPDKILFQTCNLNKEFDERTCYDLYVDVIAKDYQNVDPKLVKNIIRVESNYDPNAVGYKGQFLGLMQIAPRWHSERAERLGLTDWFNPYENIRVGVDILSDIARCNSDPVYIAMVYNLGAKSGKEKYDNGEITSYARQVVYGIA